MAVELNEVEARVLGCLLEKAVITPDQYPLTLNALTSACNQKSSREPVMNLERGQVLAAARALQDKHLVRSDENFRSQIEKFSHRFCNTPFSDYQFETPQYAIVTVLLLRGPRTPGELRANSGRLHEFASNADVVEALGTLASGDQVVVEELPRTPGRRDAEYMHLFFAPSRIEALRESRTGDTTPVLRSESTAPPAETSSPNTSPPSASAPAYRSELRSLQDQVTSLQRQVVALQESVAQLQRERE